MACWLPLAVLLLIALQQGYAAEPDQLSRFQTFFAPLLEGEWVYHTRMTGPDGKVAFDGEDSRQYRLGVRGRFLIEDVFRADGEHVGIQLYGLNVQTGDIHVPQYWSYPPR